MKQWTGRLALAAWVALAWARWGAPSAGAQEVAAPRCSLTKLTTVSPALTPAIGTATAVTLDCSKGQCPPGGLTGTAYYNVTVAPAASGPCSEIPGPVLPNPATAVVKVNCAVPGTGSEICGSGSAGTVVFVVGGAGNEFYDTNLRYGANIASQILAANYNVAQIAFFGCNPLVTTQCAQTGWQTGGPNTKDGPLATSCFYATIVEWLRDNIPDLSNGAEPLCATGHSSGSAVIGYALSAYGFGVDPAKPSFAFAEPTSGPPFARIDLGCTPHAGQGKNAVCKTCTTFSFAQDAAALVDPAYDNSNCSQCLAGNTAVCTNSTWQADSILNVVMNGSTLESQATLQFPSTAMTVLYGCLDNSGADAQGNQWLALLADSGGVPTTSCIGDAGHRIPDFMDGGSHIAQDIVTSCKLH